MHDRSSPIAPKGGPEASRTISTPRPSRPPPQPRSAFRDPGPAGAAPARRHVGSMGLRWALAGMGLVSSGLTSAGDVAASDRPGDPEPVVRVAGQRACAHCSVEELADRIHARPRRGHPRQDLRWWANRDEVGPTWGPARYALIVKFRDANRVRVDADGQLVARGDALTRRLRAFQAEHDLLVRAYITLAEERVDALRRRAMRRSLRTQPDLAGTVRIELDPPDKANLVHVGERLQALDAVEYAYIARENLPPPQPSEAAMSRGDLPPTTDSFVMQQGYLGPDPGIDAEFAWSMGLDGSGIAWRDNEYSWRLDHEEFNEVAIAVEEGQSLADLYRDHGTAVIGVIAAPHNGYGVSGIAPSATLTVYPEITVADGSRRCEAVLSSMADSRPGDVVLIEQQDESGAPSEIELCIYDAVKMGVDAGVVVVGTAGNGAQNLDSPTYASYMERGDNGAIINGSGTPDTQHNARETSTYGERVNLHGWGSVVVSTGYGYLTTVGGDERQSYTDRFGGTSAAGPMVAGAAILLQQFAVESLGGPFTSQKVRQTLSDTGIPQGSGPPVGPFPDVRAAIQSLQEPEGVPPAVVIVSPDTDVETAEVPYLTVVEVTATDESKVEHVELSINGEAVGEPDVEEPYVFEVELGVGEWVITASAEDLHGNVGTSEGRVIVVGASDDDDGADDDTFTGADSVTGEDDDGQDETGGDDDDDDDPDDDDDDDD
ncbi:MAG: hypothetical protein B7733_19555, partial [Myxococcales bacterium FL481]